MAIGVRPTKPVVYLVDRPDSVPVGDPRRLRRRRRAIPAEDTRVSAFNALFGGNFTSRINMNLREDKGWSYGARSSVSGGPGPAHLHRSQRPCRPTRPRARWSNSARSSTDVVGSNRQPPAELNTVRTNTLLGMASRWKTSSAVLGTLMDIYQFNLPADYWAKYADTYRTATPARSRRMAKKLIPNQNHVWVIVGDRAKIEKGVRELNLGEVHIVDANGDPVN